MTIVAEFGTGQVLWSILWFALFVLWIWLFITVLADIIRARDMSGWAKGLWTVAILILPLLGILLYLIVNGEKMRHRDEDDAKAALKIIEESRSRATQADVADELHRLAALHESGALDDDEYERAKNKVTSS